jgi:hypothetical protein
LILKKVNLTVSGVKFKRKKNDLVLSEYDAFRFDVGSASRFEC